MSRKSENPTAVDPLAAIISALDAGEAGEDLDQARRAAGAMDQRPWEQLPARLKSAIRTDMRRLISGGAGEEELRAAGYGGGIIRAARRDLGLGG